MTAYAELAVTTNFSFLRGASHPQDMVARADELGLAAIGITDRNSFAGVVRAYDEAKKRKIALCVGVRLVTTDGFEVLAYPTDRAAYGRLCRLLSAGNLRTKKGECDLAFEDILGASEGQMLIAVPLPALFSDRHPEVRAERASKGDGPSAAARILRGSRGACHRAGHFGPDPLARASQDDGGESLTFTSRLAALARAAPGRTFLAGAHYHRGDEPRRLGLLAELGERVEAPLVAVNEVFYHAPERRPLADVVTCIRKKCTIAEAGFRLTVNAERHIKPPEEMARLFKDFPDAVARTVTIAAACGFSLGDLKYEYPDEPVPPGKTAQQHLEDLSWAGAAERYPKDRFPHGIPADVKKRLDEELALIARLDYARYFLTVHDVVAHARKELKILCQGRGSAANSAVCYCLGITEVNPNESKLLFARFISANRNEPPDIDVDFEHERREEVIQYIYRRYGRHRAAICATVIHYRSRRAIREVGKAMGLTEDVTAALAKTVWGSHDDGLPDEHIRQAGLDPANPTLQQAVALARELLGFPRHLSQHVGGFVLTRDRLDETVPIGNAAMDDRTFIEWDKDDIDTLGLMKVDVLALGMLSCLRRGLDLLKLHYGTDHSLASIPKDGTDDAAAVYEMLSRADSIGVFQVESRAQMSMLPRLKPECFYDLVIEVAIVRPGPIQGDMVHPYLRRRDKIDPEHYPSPDPAEGPANELENVLKRTLGVPLFQEQAMQIAIDAAKFTPDEADGLRRAMATFRHNGTVHLFEDKFILGMVRRGYDRAFAERCFDQIKGFGEYGFPESHAASFALLVYASAWIKCRYPEVFCAAILNSQPMGFYQPAQLVRDARAHGVEVHAADVNFSDWDCTLETNSCSAHRADENGRHAVRLGFRLISGLREDELKKLIAARGNGFSSIERLAAVAGVSRFTIERLAEADAFRSLGLDRRAALWAARRLDVIGIRTTRTPVGTVKTEDALPLFAPHLSEELFPEEAVALPDMALGEHVVEDYVATGLSLKAHPVSFFRDRLGALGAVRNSHLRGDDLTQDCRVTIAGLVLIRQRPGTAKGVVFLTLEDETGAANVIVWPKVFDKNRRTVMTARFLAVRGRLQRVGLVIHVVAESFVDLSAELPWLRNGGNLFSPQLAGGPLPADAALPLKSRDFH
jgi:error-prone DNA polymerase